MKKVKGGAEKARERRERQRRLETELEKTSKISSFFLTTKDVDNQNDCVPVQIPQTATATAIPSGSPLCPDEDQCTAFEGEIEADQEPEQAKDAGSPQEPESETAMPVLCPGAQGNDLGKWVRSEITENSRNFWLKKGPSTCQHLDGPYDASMRIDGKVKRWCTRAMFTRVHQLTGKHTLRDWLCYSTSNGTLFCFTCFFLSKDPMDKFSTGFSDWKHAERAISRHEKSEHHLEAIRAFLARSNSKGCVDSELVKQSESAIKYWHDVLKRVVVVIKLLASRGLPFRGSDEIIGSPRNGNFLGVLEAISHFDPFLAQHLAEHGNPGRGRVSYLSSTICDEFITILARSIHDKIVAELQTAKYYSVSVDSTPDITHIDQLTVIVRYVLPAGPVERFIKFIPISSHTGVSLANALLSLLDEFEIDIAHCRGQSYDNASNMSGIYNGMQAIISAKNSLAVYVPCAGHSLNLAGKSAVDCCPVATKFFDFVQRLYVYFSRSPQRWKVLTDVLSSTRSPVVKRLCDTRWCAHADATKALVGGYASIKKALEELRNDPQQKPESRLEASNLVNLMENLETGIMTALWSEVLQRFNTISVMIQDPQLDLNSAVSLFDGLIDFTASQRSRFQYFETKGKELTGNAMYLEETRRKRKRNAQMDDYVLHSVSGSPAENNEVETLADRFRVDSFLPIVDKLVTALTNRRAAYAVISGRFGFLRRLTTLTVDEIENFAKVLVDTYPADLESDLSQELNFLASILRSGFAPIVTSEKKELKGVRESPELQMFHVIMANSTLCSSIPNVVNMLSIYLTLMTTNCSGERSFSVLKRVKNHLRATMNNDRLSNLALLCIEHEMLDSIPIDEIINDFASLKSRKKLV